jgi:hypothetical protein
MCACVYFREVGDEGNVGIGGGGGEDDLRGLYCDAMGSNQVIRDGLVTHA